MRILIAVAFLMLAGCVRTEYDQPRADAEKSIEVSTITAYEDKRRGVVCYRTFGGSARVALSCVKVKP